MNKVAIFSLARGLTELGDRLNNEPRHALWFDHPQWGPAFHFCSMEHQRFLALAVAGEAGEVANRFKKEWRGDNIPRDEFKKGVEEEMGDVLAYWVMLCSAGGLDIERLLHTMMTKIEAAEEKRRAKMREAGHG